MKYVIKDESQEWENKIIEDLYDKNTKKRTFFLQMILFHM